MKRGWAVMGFKAGDYNPRYQEHDEPTIWVVAVYEDYSAADAHATYVTQVANDPSKQFKDLNLFDPAYVEGATYTLSSTVLPDSIATFVNKQTDRIMKLLQEQIPEGAIS